jgi:hypothetical protein
VKEPDPGAAGWIWILLKIPMKYIKKITDFED